MKEGSKMDKTKILQTVDHTLLLQTAAWAQIKQICDDGIQYQCASVCIPPSYVKRARDYVKGKIAVCTVIGFPNGYQTTAVKIAETADAIANGADEIDMVVNLGDLKDGKDERIIEEIKAVKEACGGRILKVIIETCLLTEAEKIRMCRNVTSAGADFIKTSTGFSTAGATLSDILLFAEHIGKKIQIKAAGGIRSFEDGERLLAAGATRLGTSRLVELMKTGSTDSGEY